jgi:uncharacterized membrane protein YkoI
MKYSRTLCLLAALALLPLSLHAASAITRERAEATALRLVPGGTVVIGDLERENGRLVWLFDVSIPGSRNLREIHVDAGTGAVVSNTLETPTDR